jgi:hypothetical protein
LPDDYYNENFVLSNLPAGHYEIALPFLSVWRRVDVDVESGAITYFHFLGADGYDLDLPAQPTPDFLPAFANN